MEVNFSDVIIIGTGVAGLVAAEQLCMHMNVRIITKSALKKSNSFLAQGGISSAIGKGDTWERHLKDSLEAGRHFNDKHMTELLVKEAPEVIQYLENQGVLFDRLQNGDIALGREGGHLFNRIVHAGGDQTGKKVTEALIEKVLPFAELSENEYAVDLIMKNGMCKGVWCKTECGDTKVYYANQTIIASGGYSGIYEVTSNQIGSSGDGLNMAYRAGAVLADLEFVQFHPTLLGNSEKSAGLVSEAVRGEGAKLIDDQGHYFMEKFPLQDLAPRDIVAREVDKKRKAGRSVFLDISGVPHFERRFPGVTALCEKSGIDVKEKKIPVQPGAHFTMGGIVTDKYGRTSIPGLYAVGECASTGVHGANRLASNSLLEGVVFARKAARHILVQPKLCDRSLYDFSSRRYLSISPLNLHTFKEKMSRYTGIIRNDVSLREMTDWLEDIPFVLPHENHSTREIETINLHQICWLVSTSALMRKESRGAHFREDYPFPLAEWQNKQLKRRRDKHERIAAKKTAARIFP